MDSFEELLKRAMERKQPPAGFTDRVLARTRQPEPMHPRRGFILPSWFGPALAALLVLAATLGYEHYRERRQGERATQQLVVALRLTGAKLHQVRSRVVEIGTERKIDQ
jgi:transposase